MITAIGDYDRSALPVVAPQQQAAEQAAAESTRVQAQKQAVPVEEPKVQETVPPLAVEPRTYRFEFFPAVNTERLTKGGQETSRSASAREDSAEAFEEAARERLKHQVSAAYSDAKRVLA